MKRHQVTVLKVWPAMDTEIMLASSSRAGSRISKRLVYVPSINKYTVAVLDDGTEIRSPFDCIENAVEKYNSIKA